MTNVSCISTELKTELIYILDVEKQQATNVFLGFFIPRENQPNIWDLTTDFYLHNNEADGETVARRR